jgi:hypothetical protein
MFVSPEAIKLKRHRRPADTKKEYLANFLALENKILQKLSIFSPRRVKKGSKVT